MLFVRTVPAKRRQLLRTSCMHGASEMSEPLGVGDPEPRSRRQCAEDCQRDDE